ncbi:MAG TPA: VanZ family protein [Candidatus Aquilonibacter sp.]|nr:VanZ family protein [Candidatus Aquilonibacter sp.]
MMKHFQPQREEFPREFRWSLRILVLAIAGIFFLTLYPFRVNPHAYPGSNPFLLQGLGKDAGPRDAFLNVLLFIPFGFGLAGLCRKRGFSLTATAALAWIAGVFLSYSVEFAQFFIPGRDSGWEDVITNSSGSLIGCLCFLMCGLLLVRLAQTCEAAIERLASARNVAIVLVCYFALSFAVAARLQKDTALSDWQANSLLSVGGPAHDWSKQPWTGRIYSVEFWDHTLPDDAAARITSAAPEANYPSSDAIASFQFFRGNPLQDTRHDLPDLAPQQTQNVSEQPFSGTWNGGSWLATQSPVSNLVTRIQKSGRFSIHLDFVPFQVNGVNASLVAIGRPGQIPDLQIRQASEALAFWFRNPLAPRPYHLEWSIPHVFVVNQPRNVLFCFDGSKLWMYSNGQMLYSGYRLGPAASAASLIRRPRPDELQGYRYTFYAILFFPAGCLLGFAARNIRGPLSLMALIASGVIAPSILLELILVHSGAQPFSAMNVYLAIFMATAGLIWINLEGRSPRPDIELPRKSE